MAATESNSYEEIRRQRVQENLRHLEELGISRMSKGLLEEVAQKEYKILKTHPKSEKIFETSELRRSSRPRNPVPSYQDSVADIEPRSYHRRGSKNNRGERSYTGRIPSYNQTITAIKRAEKLQSDLNSDHPSFVKPMVRSHVSSCFWLGLPTRFCKDNLPLRELKMELEDEKGNEYPAIYIGLRTGLSGGWRGFALDHNLEDGDALVFELIEPDRFKVYIIKAIPEESIEAGDSEDTVAETTESMKQEEQDRPHSQKSPPETRTGKPAHRMSKRKHKEENHQPVSEKSPPEPESVKPARRTSKRISSKST